MINYDNDLIRLQQKVAMKKQLEAKLNDLRSQRCVFDKKIIELRVDHRSEQEDVKKLECRSLANYFYQLFGKLDEKLDEERKEASAAKVKLDAAERELAVVDHEIQEIQTLLRELYGCEEAYSATLEAKRDAVKSSNTPAACQILELEEKIAFLERRKSGKQSPQVTAP